MATHPLPEKESVELWSPGVLQHLNNQFASRTPTDLLHWATETFAPDIALATSFGPSGIVLMHLLAQIQPHPTIFYLDTDLLFPETYALRDRLAERLGVQFTAVHSNLSLDEQTAQYGPALWQHQPDHCCHLRKVQPLKRFLATQRAWISGIRRDQGGTRSHINLVEWDRAHQLVKLNPLAGWTRQEVWEYIHSHELPYNPLHDKGYPSIGCTHCTRPVADGDPERAGRWAGSEKTECGIHIQPDGKIVRLAYTSL